ncbi:hypothetical protein [Spirosoma pomorum]
MNSAALESLVNNRSGSAMTELLTEAPKLVEPVMPLVEAAPPLSLRSIFGGNSAQADAPDEPVEIEEEYIPLSAAEIETKAEAKAEMWCAILSMLFDFLNRYIATQSLKEGDKELIKKFEAETRALDHAPDYINDPNHPYHAASRRWEAFTKAISEEQSDAKLSEGHRLLLKRAIKAEIEKKNKRKMLKDSSIHEVLFEIAIAKAGPQMTQLLISKFTHLSASTL